LDAQKTSTSSRLNSQITTNAKIVQAKKGQPAKEDEKTLK
jgi:hypothetical protein